ncbi:MAG: hypothetical protein AB1439_04665 [candidate division FCPU426 bacterium]
MTPVRFPRWLGLGLAAWIMGAAPALAAQSPAPEAVSSEARSIQEALRQWSEEQAQISRLQAELQRLDVLSDPDRDEKYWWNPFWRWSKENQSQQATDITLRLQTHEARSRDLEHRLLSEGERYAGQALDAPRLPSPDQEVWRALDAWRLPRLLAEPDWETLSPPDDSQAHELIRSRLQSAAALEASWRSLDVYLEACQRKWDGSREEETYRKWREQLRALLERLETAREKLEKRGDYRLKNP